MYLIKLHTKTSFNIQINKQNTSVASQQKNKVKIKCEPSLFIYIYECFWFVWWRMCFHVHGCKGAKLSVTNNSNTGRCADKTVFKPLKHFCCLQHSHRCATACFMPRVFLSMCLSHQHFWDLPRLQPPDSPCWMKNSGGKIRDRSKLQLRRKTNLFKHYTVLGSFKLIMAHQSNKM